MSSALKKSKFSSGNYNHDNDELVMFIHTCGFHTDWDSNDKMRWIEVYDNGELLLTIEQGTTVLQFKALLRLLNNPEVDFKSLPLPFPFTIHKEDLSRQDLLKLIQQFSIDI